LHGGIFQDEIDLIINAREVALNLFQCLFFAADIQQSLLKNA